nr:hypothetical protein [Tanacetum cinerariifolium]
MANAIGFRTNSNPELKRNVQHVNNRNHEQRNQSIPSKPNLNFCAVHKSYSSIFVSNIPWKATVQDLWDLCNQWVVVIDVYIAAKRSKSGHWFGFVRFKNVNDINLLVSNLRVTWMGGFHLFADVTKYGRTNNRLEERSRDSKPNKVGVSGNNDASISREKPVGVSVSNKENEESSNEALMFISEDDCIDLDGIERSILAKVKDLSVTTDLLKYMSSEGFVDVGLRYVGGRWVWLEFDSTDQGLSLDGGTTHEEPLDVANCDYGLSKDDNNDSDSSSEMSSTNIEDCFKNVTGNCGAVNNNMSNNVEGEILEDHFDGDLRNDTIEDNADVNPSTNVYLDVFYRSAQLLPPYEKKPENKETLDQKCQLEILTVVSEVDDIRQDLHQVSISMLLSPHFDGGMSSKVKYCFMADFGNSVGVSCIVKFFIVHLGFDDWGNELGGFGLVGLAMDCDSCKEVDSFLAGGFSLLCSVAHMFNDGDVVLV